MPIGIAPGMGLNAYFAYNVVGFHGSGNVPYKVALAAIFVEGVWSTTHFFALIVRFCSVEHPCLDKSLQCSPCWPTRAMQKPMDRLVFLSMAWSSRAPAASRCFDSTSSSLIVPYAGWIFILLAVTGARGKLITLVPRSAGHQSSCLHASVQHKQQLTETKTRLSF